MKRCISCGNALNGEKFIHQKCAKRLFGVSYLPKIKFSLNEITQEAQKSVGQLSISGLQMKLSMKLDKKTKQLIPTAHGGEYILKPKNSVFPTITENENLCMTIAEQVGIEVPPHSLIKLGDGTLAYIVKRFDRKNGQKVHQEDFCQILAKTTEEKYDGSAEQIANKLKRLSEFPGLDIQYFYERLLLYFIIGNGDSHLKNFSINYTTPGNVRLSPAYDIVSSRLELPDERHEFAISINGKRDKITIKDFMSFAAKFNIPPKITTKTLAKKTIIVELINDSLLTHPLKQKFLKIVEARFSSLK